VSRAQPWPVERRFDLWPTTNPWRAPDWEGIYGLQLEGAPPSEEIIAQRTAHLAQLRQQWRPSSEAWRQLGEIVSACCQHWLRLKFYDPIIVALDELEGPEPLIARLRAVKIQPDETGALQASLLIQGETERPQRSSFAGCPLCLEASEPACAWVNIADLTEILVLALPEDEQAGPLAEGFSWA
jgi:hypothetical protein